MPKRLPERRIINGQKRGYTRKSPLQNQVEQYYRKRELKDTRIETKYVALARKRLGQKHKKKQEDAFLSLVDALAILGMGRKEASDIFRQHLRVQGFSGIQLAFYVKHMLEDYEHVLIGFAREKAHFSRKKTKPNPAFNLKISLPYSQRLKLVDKTLIYKPDTLIGLERLIGHITGKKQTPNGFVDASSEMRANMIIDRVPQLVFIAEQGQIWERITNQNNTIFFIPLREDRLVEPHWREKEFIGSRTASAYLGISLQEFEKLVARKAFTIGLRRIGPDQTDVVRHYSLTDINKLKEQLMQKSK